MAEGCGIESSGLVGTIWILPLDAGRGAMDQAEGEECAGFLHRRWADAMVAGWDISSHVRL